MNPIECQIIQNEMMDFLDESNIVPLQIKVHLKSCDSCQIAWSDFHAMHHLFQQLPELSPPASLTQKVFASIEQRPSFKEKLARFFNLKLVTVSSFALLAFIFGSQFFVKKTALFSNSENNQKNISAPNSPTENFKFDFLPSAAQYSADTSAKTPASSLEMAAAIPSEKKDLAKAKEFEAHANSADEDWRFLDENPSPELEQPLIAKTDVSTLTQASEEEVAAFKHHLALRYLQDGDYSHALALFGSLIKDNINYSQWEIAIIQKIEILKKLGQKEEIQKDLNRLREYSLTSVDFVKVAESLAE